jgi:uncharacterized protein (DUF1501 family)
MKRRNFLRILPSVGATSFAVNGFSMRPFANEKMAQILGSCDDVSERTLVLIQLKGGNDGLNNIIPIAQYSQYAALRPSIKIAESNLLALDNTLADKDKVGLHPSLSPIKALYEKGWASIVQGVGYASMNQSHFKGTDLWLSGGDSTVANNSLSSGWMGRSLQAMYPDVKGAPTTEMPDPLGLQIGDPSPSLGFHTETEHQNAINLSGQDVAGFYSLVQTIGGAPVVNVPDSEHGDELNYIMNVERSVNKYAARISQVFNAGSNSTVAYANNSFSNQLKTVARLIRGGCKTKIYLCQLGGFDTHNAQTEINATESGTHADLLANMATGVKAFFDDLEALGIADKVTACTFSEFGRCAKENGSYGSDHGTLEPVYVFGKHIKAGVQGTNVNLSDLTQDNQLKGVQFDYRRIFTTLLQDWLGANNYVLDQTMFDGFTKMPLLDTPSIADPGCYIGGTITDATEAAALRAFSVFPNPANIITSASLISDTAYDARLTLHSMGGSVVFSNTVRVEAGENYFDIDVFSLTSGTYFVRIENKNNGRAQVAKLNVVR